MFVRAIEQWIVEAIVAKVVQFRFICPYAKFEKLAKVGNGMSERKRERVLPLKKFAKLTVQNRTNEQKRDLEKIFINKHILKLPTYLQVLSSLN